MGDVYRLVSSGVRLIILIDGIFHSQPAIWQRELLAALQNGIMILGAASMGALRAAELAPFGMIGCGTIFAWYRDGMIDGDDEVALLHADSSQGFRPLSEPLINMRYNLLRAVQQGVISQVQYEALIAFLKATDFTQRSYRLLFDNPVINYWSQEERQRLQTFIEQTAVDVKRQDALEALTYGATLLAHPQSCQREALPTRHAIEYERIALLKRGFLHPSKQIISAEEWFASVPDDPSWQSTLRPRLITNFFLQLWAYHRKLSSPQGDRQRFYQRWLNTYVKGSYTLWLRHNGLTAAEFASEIDRRALLHWMTTQSPEDLGIAFRHHAQVIAAITSNQLGVAEGRRPAASRVQAVDRCQMVSEALQSCMLADYARAQGISCPPEEVATYRAHWEATWGVTPCRAWLRTNSLSEAAYRQVLATEACRAWMVSKGPGYFGYRSWSWPVALLRELQMTGQAVHMVHVYWQGRAP